MNDQASFNNNWRKTAATIYKKPTDSRIFGNVEFDVTDLEKYITEKRKSGLKITMTHITVLAVARALGQEVPELNCYIRRGNVVHRKSVDAMVSVLLPGGQMGSVKVDRADQLTLTDAVEVMSGKIKNSRKGNENKTMKTKSILASLPWPFRKWVFRVYKLLTIDWGFSTPGLNISANSFGSFMVTNIGSLGLDMGIPALLPSSNISMVIVLGGTSKKPAVVNDEIVPRRILSMGAVLDHRLVDASHGGRLFRYLKYIFKNPEILENKPE